MLKFIASLKDTKIKSLFRFACDYLDVYVDNKVMVVFAEKSALFAMATIPLISSEGYSGPQNFRIPKAGFLNILQEGILRFLCDEDSVYVNIENKKISHSMKFARQICNLAQLEARLALVSTATQYPKFKIADLVLPIRILKHSPLALAVENKIAYSVIENMHIYAKTECCDCALFPESLNQLVSLCDGNYDNVYNVRDCVVYSDGMYHLVVNKVIPRAGNDIEHVMRQKVKYRVNVDFGQAVALLTRVRDYIEVDLNLRRQELVLKTKDCEFSTRISLSYPKPEKAVELEDILKMDYQDVPRISFPISVFKSIIYTAKSKQLDIVCTRNRVRIGIRPGLMLVCRKVAADE